MHSIQPVILCGGSCSRCVAIVARRFPQAVPLPDWYIKPRRRIYVEGEYVLVMDLACRENRSDLRNTQVIDVMSELNQYDCSVNVFDPWVDIEECHHEYEFVPVATRASGVYDANFLELRHQLFLEIGLPVVQALGKKTQCCMTSVTVSKVATRICVCDFFGDSQGTSVIEGVLQCVE